MEREVSELDRKLILKRNYLDKIYYHLNKDPIDQDELYQFVRKFFGEYLKLDYEFTYEELSQELNKAFIKPKVKDQIDNFLLRLSESEYLEDSSLGTSEINSYLNELSDIIKNIIYEEGKLLEPTSVIKKVFSSKDDSKTAIITGITASIDEITFHINKGNTDSAKTIYANMMKNYESLSKSDKKSLHDQVNAIYEKLQILIKNPERATAEKMYSTPKADKSQELTRLISEALSYVEQGNSELAKNTYAKALKIYESLDQPLRINFKPVLMELFEGLQSMSSKKSTPVKPTPNIQNKLSNNATTPNLLNQTTDLNQSSTQPINQSNPTIQTDNDTKNKEPILPTIPSSLNEDISTGGNVLFGVSSNSTNVEPNVNINSGESKTNAASTIVSKEEIRDKSSTPAASNSALSSKNLPEMDVLPVEERKILDEDENKIQSFSSDLDKHINSLLTSKNIDTKTSDGDINSFATDSINKALAKSAIQEDSNSKNSSSTLAPNSESNNFTLITPVDSNSLGADNIKINSDDKLKSKSSEKSTTKEIPVSESPQVKKLKQLLSRINDDVNIERLDSAKKLYKEALLIYRSLNDSQKAVCYKDFYSTFKKLDEGLHKESLHQIIANHSDVNLLDTSLSNTNASLSNNPVNSLSSNNTSSDTISDDLLSTSSNKINIITVGSEDKINSKISSGITGLESEKNLNTTIKSGDEYVPESLEVLKLSTLPVLMDNNPETTRVYELIEESYFNLSNKNNDLAMLKYFKALDLYKRLNLEDKKKTYSNIYELFKTITGTTKN